MTQLRIGRESESAEPRARCVPPGRKAPAQGESGEQPGRRPGSSDVLKPRVSSAAEVVVVVVVVLATSVHALAVCSCCPWDEPV